MDRTTATRRRLLVGAGSIAGVAGIAGCLDGGTSDGGANDSEGGATEGDPDDDGDGESEEQPETPEDEEENGEETEESAETTTEDESDEETEESGETATEDGSENADETDEGESETTDEPRDVSFRSTDGAALEGTIYGDGDCAVVLTPQINQERGSWEPQATRIADEGYTAFAIDVDGDDYPGSVEGAIDYLRDERESEGIVLVGASIGGEASVIANARAEGELVRGVVAISPGGGADHAADLTGETLFAVAEDDDDRFVETTETLHEEAPDPTELRTYDGSAHGQGLFDTEHGDDLFEGIVGLVGDACGS